MTKKPVWREYFEAILIALALALIIRAFLIQAYKIPSGSMFNTLLVGDRLLVNKFVYGVKLPFSDSTLINVYDPEIGDVIVFAYPEDPSIDFIKRIVGLPGDKIEIRNKALYRNGQLIQEPYVRHSDAFVDQRRDFFGPVTVPENHYFVLGDNRDESKDSRYWGFVDRTAIRGKAWRIYWSWSSEPRDNGSLDYENGLRWNRLGKLVQ